MYDIIVIGGGAAGFFTAINTAEKDPKLKIAILERGKEVLTKVKVSGGGRCNVTHAEFIPQELSKNYPRGEKELLGPFHHFMTGDTMQWFEERGVPLKIEDDGRVFPESNSSQSIIDCFLTAAKNQQIEILKGTAVKKIEKNNGNWAISTNDQEFETKKIVVATGSNSKIWKLLEKMGHTVVTAVPSLFTFNCKDNRIQDLSGLVADNVTIKVKDTNLETIGPLLITHWGMSAPAILKLSAWGARILNEKQYKFALEINFVGQSFDETLVELKKLKLKLAKNGVYKNHQFAIPKRLWRKLVLAAAINETDKWADLTSIQLRGLTTELSKGVYTINGKSTFKEEFVSAGGIDLKEVNFKTFESRKHKDLYFAGEVLNIDAITGGFNFQNAWTGGFMIANAITR